MEMTEIMNALYTEADRLDRAILFFEGLTIDTEPLKRIAKKRQGTKKGRLQPTPIDGVYSRGRRGPARP